MGRKLYEEPLVMYLALYAPAPENAPDDWYHHAEENLAAWQAFIRESEERGYYSFPIGDGEMYVDKV